MIYEVDTFSKSDIFFHLVDKYVYRTKINQKFKDEVAKMDPEEIFNRTIANHLCQKLFDKSKSMKYLYGSSDELISTLNQLTKFPDNSEYLGLKDTANMTFFAPLNGRKGKEYLSKSEAFVAYFYPRVAILSTSDFEKLAINFVGNEVYRENKENFQLIEREYFCMTVMKHFDMKIKIARGIDHHFHKEIRMILEKDKNYVNGMGNQIREKGISWNDKDDSIFHKILNHEKLKLVDNTIDEVYEKFADLFDRNYDEKCFKKLRQLLEEENKLHPIRDNYDHYQRIYRDVLINYREVLRFFFKSETFTKIYPNLRIFIDEEHDVERKFFLAKDVLRILEMLMSEKNSRVFPKGLISIENEEERKMGILRIVEYDTFEQILKVLKISIDDINLVNVPLKFTDREDVIPVNSPYGTYCKLAKHAFCDVFEQISIGMNLWKSMEKQNFPKVFEFFEKLTENDEIFGANRDYQYFVETWKIDEIIDLAYEELLKYSTTNMYVFPNKKSKNTYSENEAMKELKKFAPNFENQKELTDSFNYLVKNEKRPITQKIIGFIFENGIRNAFVDCHPKIAKFVDNQNCPRRIEIGCCSDVKKISFSEHSELYRETIKRVISRFGNGTYITKHEFDEIIENEMNSDVEHLGIETEEDKAAYILNLQAVAEFFETKTVNNHVFLRKKDAEMEEAKMDEQLYETPSSSSAGNSSGNGGNRILKQNQSQNQTLKENTNKKPCQLKNSNSNQNSKIEGSSQAQNSNQKKKLSDLNETEKFNLKKTVVCALLKKHFEQLAEDETSCNCQSGSETQDQNRAQNSVEKQKTGSESCNGQAGGENQNQNQAGPSRNLTVKEESSDIQSGSGTQVQNQAQNPIVKKKSSQNQAGPSQNQTVKKESCNGQAGNQSQNQAQAQNQVLSSQASSSSSKNLNLVPNPYEHPIAKEDRILRENTNLNSSQNQNPTPTPSTSQVSKEDQISIPNQQENQYSNVFNEEKRVIRQINKLFRDRNTESRQTIRRFLDNLSLNI